MAKPKSIHFGVICPPVPGHLFSLMGVGRVLQERGHKISVFTLADAETLVKSSGFEAVLLGQKTFPHGHFGKIWKPLSQGHGWNTTVKTARLKRLLADIFCDEVPLLAELSNIEALLIDQGQFYGFAIAEALGIPFYSIASAIHFPLARDLDYPPPGARWGYRAEHAGFRFLNALLYRALDRWGQEALERGNRLAKERGTRQRRTIFESFSPHFTLTQIPRVLDYPLNRLQQPGASPLYHLGPYRLLSKPADEQRANDNLVFCSFGTLQNGRRELYETVLRAATYFPKYRFVISRGTWTELAPDPLREKLPKNVVVVPFADQLALLSKASAMITHAGANSVSECVYFGVPMVCVPITNDQPYIARRVADQGFGKVLPLRRFDTDHLVKALSFVLDESDRCGMRQRILSASRATRSDMKDTGWIKIIENTISAKRRKASRMPL